MVAVLSLNCPTVYSHSHSMAHRAAVDGRNETKRAFWFASFQTLDRYISSVLRHTERFPREQNLSVVLLPIFIFFFT